VKQLDYDSQELKPLRKYLDGKEKKDTPIDSQLKLELSLDESKDVQLLKDLAFYALPPLSYISIKHLSGAAEEMKHFLVHSLGQLTRLDLNHDSDLLDGSEWVEAIANALLRVKERALLCNFSFTKEQVEIIVDNTLHLEWLVIRSCKLRKWCCLVYGSLILRFIARTFGLI
jgi:hypothetical protein